MTSYVSNGEGDASIRKLLPVEIVSTCRVSRFIPAGYVEAIDSRRLFGKKPLLNRTGDIQIVLQCGDFGTAFQLTQSCNYVLTDLPGHRPCSESAEE